MSRLERWSRRKRGDDNTGVAEASNVDPVIDDTRGAESGDSLDTLDHDSEADNVVQGSGEPPAPGSLDATLPDPESLAPGSDIKAFLEPGVSSGLRRRALRRLFAGDKYGIRDGLDDYDHDYREMLKPLASELAQRMRKWTAPADGPPEALEEKQGADELNRGEAQSPADQREQPAEQDEDQDEKQDDTPPIDESMASTESRQPDDDSILDQGRGGNRQQSGQD